MAEDNILSAHCQICGQYSLWLFCYQCKLNCCQNCFIKWHEKKKITDHNFVNMLPDGSLELVSENELK
jgi:hypothetical protein